MSCTTILVGKKASYDGSTMIARTEDSQSGDFCPKQFKVVNPEDQPRHYKSVLSSFEMDLPANPMRYTSVPNALDNEGIWGEAGINAVNVAMSECKATPRSTCLPHLYLMGLADQLPRHGYW